MGGYVKLKNSFFYNNTGDVSFKDIGTLGFCLYCYLVRCQRFDNSLCLSIDIILKELCLQKGYKEEIINSLLVLEKYNLITFDNGCKSSINNKMNVYSVFYISIVEPDNYVPMYNYDWEVYKYFTKNTYVLYWLIKMYYNSDHKCSFPSYELMCYVTGFSNSTVGKIINEFNEMGIFHVHNKGWKELDLGSTQKKKYNNEYNINVPGIEKILKMSVEEYRKKVSELKKDAST